MPATDGRPLRYDGAVRTRRSYLVTLLYFPTVSLLLAVAISAWVMEIAPSRFVLDPSVLAEAHPLLGVVSNVGVLLWAAAGAISLFTAALLRGNRRNPEDGGFLMAAGVATTVLMLDDLFLFHEWLFPEVLGVPQPLVLTIYAFLSAAFVLRFAALILGNDYLLLALAIVFFTVSVAVDQLPSDWFQIWNWLYLLEDGFKLLGIVSWSGYLIGFCAGLLGERGGQF